MRRFWVLLICLLLVAAVPRPVAGALMAAAAVSAPGPAPSLAAPPAQLSLSSPSYILLDLNTGQVLAERLADVARPPASVTKVMTALLALEWGDPREEVTISPRAEATAGTTAWLEAGQTYTLQDMLYALMLESANDAAVAIAEHLAGTEEAFARFMTERAGQLGATGTVFRTASGLDGRRGEVVHVSTARDLAAITRVAMQRAGFRDLVTTVEYPLGAGVMHNLNAFLFDYPGATGVKNGWTPRAGNTLIVAARRGPVELVAVVLGAPGRDAVYWDAERLMDFGFAAYIPYQVVAKGDPVQRVYLPGSSTPVQAVAARTASVHLPAGAGRVHVGRRVELEPGLVWPVSRGSVVGWLGLTLDGQAVGEVPLVAGE